MPDYLALDWETHRIAGIDAQVSKGRVRAVRLFKLDWPEGLGPTDKPAEAGAWLKGELAKRGASARQVLVSLPREDAVVRRLELPDVPDDELADMVRLQAATRSSSSLDRLVLDYLPLPKRPEQTGREVLLTTLPVERVERLRRLLTAAELELSAIGLSPVAAAELVARAEPAAVDAGPSLTIARHGERVEISLLRAGRLVSTHSALVADTREGGHQAILAEVTRSLVSQQQILSGASVTRAWVIGGEDESRGLCESLAQRLSCTCGTIDPLSQVTAARDAGEFALERAALAGPVGMLLAASGPRVEHVDFVNPRKPVPKGDRRKRNLTIGGAVAAALVVAAFGGTWWYAAALDAQIADKEAELNALNGRLEQSEPTMASAKTVAAWDAQRVDWLEQLKTLNELLPGTENAYVTKFTLDRAAGEGLGRIQATGFARRQRDVEQVAQQLSDRNYQVKPTEINRTGRNEEYPYQFTLDVTLVAPKAARARGPLGRG
ncbi:MAG: hypothetical protein KY476_20615 [Planctomycetes bacterium]|nr:hypothetical protein [Planctomycetota bacterium]